MKPIIALTLLAVISPGAALAKAQDHSPIVSRPQHMATSDSIADIASKGKASLFDKSNGPTPREFRRFDIPKPKGGPNAPAGEEASLALATAVSVPANTPYNQTANFQPLGVTIVKNFEALGVGTPGFTVSGAPPDPALAVSETQIVQWVNTQLAVYDKNGAPLLAAPGFINGNAIWAALGAGSLCATTNRGDPQVQFDRLARRWILSQFAFNSTFSQNAQCIAVSTTDNALGSYALYEYNFGSLLPDFAKLAVWPDAYYLSYNMFNVNANTFNGGQVCAYDRAKMLSGLPATQICFNSTDRFSFLPSDMDGVNPPPAGTPNYVMSWNWAFTAAPPYTMQLTKFKPDFVTPGNSTFDDGFGGGAFSFVAFSLDSGTKAACNDIAGACVPQLGTTQRLDTLSDRQQSRLVYRNFGTYDALLFTQATDNRATTAADLRWWEIRDPGAAAPVVFQNSTYMPGNDFRWMGSAAFDKLGNIAIGYSASSATINPQIRIAGRRKTDPKNLLRSEVTVMAGTGSQTASLRRWGDYTTMQVDPIDDCTFWYTNQYLASNGTFNWRTRIVGFKFPNCN
jgi:hypothetical protein